MDKAPGRAYVVDLVGITGSQLDWSPQQIADGGDGAGAAARGVRNEERAGSIVDLVGITASQLDWTPESPVPDARASAALPASAAAASSASESTVVAAAAEVALAEVARIAVEAESARAAEAEAAAVEARLVEEKRAAEEAEAARIAAEKQAAADEATRKEEEDTRLEAEREAAVASVAEAVAAKQEEAEAEAEASEAKRTEELRAMEASAAAAATAAGALAPAAENVPPDGNAVAKSTLVCTERKKRRHRLCVRCSSVHTTMWHAAGEIPGALFCDDCHSSQTSSWHSPAQRVSSTRLASSAAPRVAAAAEAPAPAPALAPAPRAASAAAPRSADTADSATITIGGWCGLFLGRDVDRKAAAKPRKIRRVAADAASEGIVVGAVPRDAALEFQMLPVAGGMREEESSGAFELCTLSRSGGVSRRLAVMRESRCLALVAESEGVSGNGGATRRDPRCAFECVSQRGRDGRVLTTLRSELTGKFVKMYKSGGVSVSADRASTWERFELRSGGSAAAAAGSPQPRPRARVAGAAAVASASASASAAAAVAPRAAAAETGGAAPPPPIVDEDCDESGDESWWRGTYASASSV